MTSNVPPTKLHDPLDPASEQASRLAPSSAAAPQPPRKPTASAAVGAPTAKRKRGTARKGDVTLLGRIAPPVLLFLALVLVWEVVVRLTHVAPEVLPAPSRVLAQGWAVRQDLWNNLLPTLYVTLIGFAVALVVGWVLAIVIDFSPWLRRGLMPLLVASQTIPIIAIAPLVIIWFGFGLLPKVLVIALVTFFPVTVGLVEGFDKTDSESANLVRSMGGNRWKLFCHVRLPSALPTFFTALRISITYAVTGAIFAEYVGAEYGLGIYMSLQKDAFRTDLVLAAVFVTAVLSVLLFLLTYVVEYLVIPWNIKARKRGKQ